MIKIYPILAALLLFMPHGAAAAPGADLIDLAKTPWGTTQEETLKILNAPKPPPGEAILVTGNQLNGIDVGHLYFFRNNQLAEIHIQTPGDTNPAELARLASFLKEDLHARYGKAIAEDRICPDERQNCTFTVWDKDSDTRVVLIEEGRISVVYHTAYPAPVIKPQLDDSLKPEIAEGIMSQLPKFPKGTGPLPPELTIRIQDDSVRVSFTEQEATMNSGYLAEGHGHMCVAGVVQALMQAGINPGSDDIAVSCWIYSREGKGLTGKKLVRQYGVARYDPDSDGVKWQTLTK